MENNNPGKIEDVDIQEIIQRLFPYQEQKFEFGDTKKLRLDFPQFNKDYAILLHAGILKEVDIDHYEWTKSKASLSEYFWWIGRSERNKISGGYWQTMENVFRIKRKMLAKLKYKYDVGDKKSHDFREIKNLVEAYRKGLQTEISEYLLIILNKSF